MASRRVGAVGAGAVGAGAVDAGAIRRGDMFLFEAVMLRARRPPAVDARARDWPTLVRKKTVVENALVGPNSSTKATNEYIAPDRA